MKKKYISKNEFYIKILIYLKTNVFYFNKFLHNVSNQFFFNVILIRFKGIEANYFYVHQTRFILKISHMIFFHIS